MTSGIMSPKAHKSKQSMDGFSSIIKRMPPQKSQVKWGTPNKMIEIDEVSGGSVKSAE